MIRKLMFVLVVLVLMASGKLVLADSPDDRQAVQATDGTIVHNTYGNCVRTRWMAQGDECQTSMPTPAVAWIKPSPPARMVAHTVISEAARTVYFVFNKATLTDQAKAQLDTLANTLKAAKDIQEAHVVGAADRIGSVGYNDKLSEKRAIAVRDYLIARGYTNASVTKTRWVGKSEPTTDCSKKMAHKKLVACLQNDRRVKIDIVYRSEVMAPPNSTPVGMAQPVPAPPVPSPVIPSR